MAVLDLRDRCQRPRCRKLIRKGKMAQANYQRYRPYCSYGCQEWHRLEQARAYLDAKLATADRTAKGTP